VSYEQEKEENDNGFSRGCVVIGGMDDNVRVMLDVFGAMPISLR